MEIQPYDDEFDPLGSSSFFCDKGASCSRPSALAAGRREDHAPENGSVFIGDVCGMPFTAEDVAEQQRLMNACAARHKTVDVEAEVFGERLAEQGARLRTDRTCVAHFPPLPLASRAAASARAVRGVQCSAGASARAQARFKRAVAQARLRPRGSAGRAGRCRALCGRARTFSA